MTVPGVRNMEGVYKEVYRHYKTNTKTVFQNEVNRLLFDMHSGVGIMRCYAQYYYS